jgi:hypothetical protein
MCCESIHCLFVRDHGRVDIHIRCPTEYRVDE